MKRLLLVGGLALLCCSCSILDPRNRPLMYQVQKHLVPEDRTNRILVAPLTIPACMAAAMIDLAVIRPISVADDAWYDTESVLWNSSGSWLEYAFLPLRVALTPILWGGDFAARWMFPQFPEYPPSPTIRRPGSGCS